MAHKFEPGHIGRLLREERVKDLQPEKFLRDAGLRAGGVLVDVGSGPGFFSIPASSIVGPSGRVYAIDTQQEMLDYIVANNPPVNIAPIKSSESVIPVEASVADMALVAFVLHEADDFALFLKEVKRLLKPLGTIIVLDWIKQTEAHGPPVEERITGEETAALLGAAGFCDIVVAEINASHYKVSAKKLAE